MKPQNKSGTKFSLSSPKFLVTNKNLTGDTRVKVVDVTGNTDKLNVFDTSVKTRIKNLLEGKIFRIEESELYSKSRGDSGHFTASQNNMWKDIKTEKQKANKANRLVNLLIASPLYVMGMLSILLESLPKIVMRHQGSIKLKRHIYTIFIRMDIP